jgi:hypothetical protein
MCMSMSDGWVAGLMCITYAALPSRWNDLAYLKHLNNGHF